MKNTFHTAICVCALLATNCLCAKSSAEMGIFMSLQFVLGNSGSGKSHLLYENIVTESTKYTDKNYMIIVPEQFTMQTQKDIVGMHPHRGVMDIDIVSFERLAHRIFDEIGGQKPIIIEETGKSLILRKIAERKKSELKFLGSNLKKTGYIGEMKSLISELVQYHIPPDEVNDLIEAAKGHQTLQIKLREIQEIYKEFCVYLDGLGEQERASEDQKKYITAEETLEVLCNVIEQSGIMRGSVIAIDGFTGFTPIQLLLMKKILLLAEKVTVAVTFDGIDDPNKLGKEHELFYISKRMIQQLRQIAEENGIKQQTDIILKNRPYRFRQNSEMAFLEKQLFRYGERRKSYGEKMDNIRLSAEKNPLEEVRYTACEIRRLLLEKGIRYHDIAVVLSDMEQYAGYIEKIFSEYRIPCFLDRKQSVLSNPFVGFIRSVIEVMEMDFTYESVFRYLRSGFGPIEDEETDLLENYVLALGIRGYRKWSEPWVRKYRGMKAEELPILNELRQCIAEKFNSLHEIWKQKSKTSVGAVTKVLYQMLGEGGAEEKLDCYTSQFQMEGQLALSKEFEQIYGIVLNLFDKLIDLLGEECFVQDEYGKILEAGFLEAKVGTIPPSIDCVVVGDIERTRLNTVKILFFLGVNDGAIPKTGRSGGLLSEQDRELLLEKQIELAPTARQNTYTQRFYLYLVLTKPMEALYLTYSKSGAQGKSIRPSYLIRTFRKMFPQLVIEDGEERSSLFYIVTPQSGISAFIKGLRQEETGRSTLFQELCTWYGRNGKWESIVLPLIEAAQDARKVSVLGRQAAKELYGDQLENSVTRLERFAGCAYAHFLSYGLNLRERELYQFRPVDMGNVFHQAMELFSKKVENNGYNWENIPEPERDQIIEESVRKAAADYSNTVLQSSSRSKYIVERMQRILKRTVWALSNQLKKGEFRIKGYEVSFSEINHLDSLKIALSEEESMRLRGRIDRIDTCDKNDNIYVKVIDYKSGSASFDLVSVYHGLQLQLVVYLNAAMELEQKSYRKKAVIPAGIFYYNMDDPFIDSEMELSPEQVEQLIKEKLKMNGLVNADQEVIHLLDKEIGNKSDVIPVAYNKDGSLSRYSSTAEEKDFSALISFVEKKIKEIGLEILEGNIEKAPYKYGKRTACDYCDYRAICGFDEKLPECNFHNLKQYKQDELWGRIREEAE